MTLDINLRNLATRLSTEAKSLRTLINGNQSTLAGLTTTAKSNLVAAINELDAAIDSLQAGGSATTLEELTDVEITLAAAGHVLRHDGSEWVNVLGTDHFQERDAALDAVAGKNPTTYGLNLLELANQAAFMGLVAAATESVQGKVELATSVETTTGTDTTRATHPAGVKAAIEAAISAAAGNYQPLDSDLTAISEVTTTAYGRALLALADQAALKGLLPTASETATGLVELATIAEATEGADTTRAVTPAGLDAAVAAGLAELVDGAPAELDTLRELAEALQGDESAITAINAALANRVRTDTAAQGLTTQEQANARTNINAVSATDIGDTDTDYVAIFEAGLA